MISSVGRSCDSREEERANGRAICESEHGHGAHGRGGRRPLATATVQGGAVCCNVPVAIGPIVQLLSGNFQKERKENITTAEPPSHAAACLSALCRSFLS